MQTKSMVAIGFAAALALVGAAQAQTSMPQGPGSEERPSGTNPAERVADPTPQGTNTPQSTNPAQGATTTQPGMQQGNAGTQRASRAEQAFMRGAIQSDLAEVKMGQLAQQKGHSDDVKQFGQTLQQDHQQNLQQAQQVAQQIGVNAPTQPSAQQTKTYERLSKLSGANFDKQFARDMVSDHKKDVSKFQAQAKKQGPVAQFAQQTVPTLQKHLQMAQQIANKGAMTGSGRNAR